MAEYGAGRTPNPCLRATRGSSCRRAGPRLALGFERSPPVTTPAAHRARLAIGARPRTAKDQSYVLGVLTQGQLAHAMFPLGDTLKPDIRAEAERRGLAVAKKPDSHDICFIATATPGAGSPDQLGSRRGRDRRRGRRGGRHPRGRYGFTVGQRKGLGIGTPRPTASRATSWTSLR